MKKSLLGSAFAFLLATSCCWLPFLLAAIGGASSMAAFSAGLEKFSGLFFLLGMALLGWSGFVFWKKRKAKTAAPAIQLKSILTCPQCGHRKEETMPTDACQFFYECENCKTVLKPKPGDCCVYCSFGTVACPPIQAGENCC